MRQLRAVFALFFFLSAVCHGQYYSFQKFTVKEGLPHSNVFRIYQDTRGFLWLATDFGLSRYDGKQFVNYSVGSEAANCVLSVSESSGYKIWACMHGGGLYHLTNDSLSIFQPSLLPKTPLYSEFDSAGGWVVERTGNLYRIGPQQTVKVSDYRTGPSYRRVAIKNNIAWFAADSGVYTSAGGKFLHRVYEDIIHERVYSLQVVDDISIWAALKDRVIRINDSKIVEEYSLGSNTDISDMLVDGRGNIWVAIPGRGIFIKRTGQEDFTDATDKLQLRNILINDLFEDRLGNVWIGTHGSGLVCVQSLDILTYPVHQNTVNNYTKAITYHDGKIFFGSIGTISVHSKGNTEPFPLSSLRKIDYIYFIEFAGDRMLVGTPNKLIVKDIRTPFSETHIKTFGCISAYTDADRRTWIGGFKGVSVLERGKIRDLNIPLLNSRRVNCITGNEKGELFFGTDSGVIYSNGKSYFALTLPFKRSLWVNNIYVDREGRIWYATDGGVAVQEGTAITLISSPGAISATSLAEDRAGIIWIGTSQGISRYQGGQITAFDQLAGLGVNEVLSLSCDSSNSIWIGSVNGIFRVARDEIDQQIPSASVFITKVRSGSRQFFFPHTASFYSPENIQVDFSGIELPGSSRLEYQYSITRDRWYSVSGNSIELSSLPLGDHLLMIRTRHVGGSWGKPAEVRLVITGPFWRAQWFPFLIAGLICTVLFFMIKWQLTRLHEKKRKEASLKDKMVHLKQQALSALINPHFIFNCLNSIQSYIQHHDREQANKYLVQFSRLVRITLDHAKESFISLQTEIDRIHLYLQLEKLRFGDKLTYTIDLTDLKNPEEIKIPNMVIQPYIENAIKHGIMPKREGGHISISMQNTIPGRLKILIEDNGLGIESGKAGKIPQSQHNSLGMSLTSERLALLEQLYDATYDCEAVELKDEKGSPGGTRVTLIFDYQGKGKITQQSVADVTS